MADVHAVGAGPAARVQEERLALLIAIENDLKVSVTEDYTAAHEAMGSVAGDSFEALEKGLVDLLGAELDNQLVVVNCLDIAVLVNFLEERARSLVTMSWP